MKNTSPVKNSHRHSYHNKKSFNLICLKVLLIVLIGQLLFPIGADAKWQDNIVKLVLARSISEQQQLIDAIIEARPNWQDVTDGLQRIKIGVIKTGEIKVSTTRYSDGIDRPWVLYVPSAYRAEKPTSLIVALHGTASRQKLIDTPQDFNRGHPYTDMAEKNGWLIMFPFAQNGATWFDDVGLDNIHNLVREVERDYNVNDNSVWMMGFSDGGSGSFAHAMLRPSDYGAFVALNGSMGVGSSDGNLHTYAPNFFNSPVYAVTNNQDGLYPTGAMLPAIEMARRAGGNITHNSYDGLHQFKYGPKELPLIAEFLMNNPRERFPKKIVWETVASKYGLCRWFSIELVTTDDPSVWHQDHNIALVDSTIYLGFTLDSKYKGKGLRVGQLVGRQTVASRSKLVVGDIILSAGGKPVANESDLNSYLTTLSLSDLVKMEIERNGETITLSGPLPEPWNYLLFKRDKPSSLVKVTRKENHLTITGSRLGAFKL